MITLNKIVHIKILKSPLIWISVVFVSLFLAFFPGSISGVFGTIEPGGELPNFRNSDILIKTQISGSIIITGLIMVIIGSFTESYIKINNSLFSRNLYLSRTPKYKYYFSSIFPIFTYSILYLIFSFGLLFLYDYLGLISGMGVTENTAPIFKSSDFLEQKEKNIINWSNVQWSYLVYSFFLSISIAIALSLLVTTISKSSTTYISIIWGYVFLIFFFGGSSVPLPIIRDYGGDIVAEEPFSAFVYISYLIPNVYTNFLFIDALTNRVDINDVESLINFLVPLVILILLFVFIIFYRKVFKK